LHRLVAAVGGRLVLSDLHPHLLSTLRRLKLHTLMTIRSCQRQERFPKHRT
jgi:hypothetical protein